MSVVGTKSPPLTTDFSAEYNGTFVFNLQFCQLALKKNREDVNFESKIFQNGICERANDGTDLLFNKTRDRRRRLLRGVTEFVVGVSDPHEFRQVRHTAQAVRKVVEDLYLHRR